MSNRHCPNCPAGLATCIEHPRRSVIASIIPGAWLVYGPNGVLNGAFSTHAEAIRYATAQASADQLAALEAQPGEVTC